ncbi:MAG: 3'-5' exonuclease [Candidatus Aminicenantales bacterium]
MLTQQPRFFLFDCETTGLPRTRYFSPDDVEGWPRLVQVAWGRFDSRGNAEEAACHIIRPDGFRIPADATKIHGITQARALRAGRELGEVLDEFLGAAERPGTVLVAHNLDYDFGVIGGELVRMGKPLRFLDIPGICTMKSTTDLCRLPRPGGFGFKWPTLEELHVHLFGRAYEGAHDAARDLEACARSFFRLWQAGHYPSL